MLDMDLIQEQARAHHADGVTDIDELHNDQHARIKGAGNRITS